MTQLTSTPGCSYCICKIDRYTDPRHFHSEKVVGAMAIPQHISDDDVIQEVRATSTLLDGYEDADIKLEGRRYLLISIRSTLDPVGVLVPIIDEDHYKPWTVLDCLFERGYRNQTNNAGISGVSISIHCHGGEDSPVGWERYPEEWEYSITASLDLSSCIDKSDQSHLLYPEGLPLDHHIDVWTAIEVALDIAQRIQREGIPARIDLDGILDELNI